MALNVFWTRRADKKFDSIIDYLNDEWGEIVATSFVRRVYEFIEILVEFPEIGKIENAERGIRG